MTVVYILIGIVVGIGTFFLIFRAKRASAPESTGFSLLAEQVNELRRTVDSKLTDTEKSMRESIMHQSKESRAIITDITERLTRLDEANKQVISFTDQLQNIGDMLKNPKQRGILGEYYLETLLKNVLPPGSYQMQYEFPDKTIVDAVVFVKEKIIPIDSKFSLENYNRIMETRDAIEKERFEKLFVADLKNRIVETSKYVKPENGTMDFAFMFIPHEAIYYDLIVNKIGAITEETENLIERAASKYKVIIVSPTSFLAYLQTVMQGLRALKIEETAKDIIKRVEELGKHIKGYEEYHGKLGISLNTVVNHFNASGKELKKIDKDVLRISGSAPGIEIDLIEKTNNEND